MKRIVPIIILVFLVSTFTLSGCTPKPEKKEKAPEPIAAVRPADPKKAVEIPESPYLVLPNELVVLLIKGQNLKSFKKTIHNTDIKIVGHIPELRVVQLEVPSDKREAIKAELKKNPTVEEVTYQILFQSQLKMNDPVFNNDDLVDDWGLQAMNIEAAWEITQGDPSVIIAIIDYGVLVSHEELQGKIFRPGSLFSENGAQIGGRKVLLHGTHVAIIAAGAANNGAGTSGVAPKSLIMPVQIGNDSEGGYFTDAIAGIGYAVKNGAKVINMSIAPLFKKSTIKYYANPAKRRKLQQKMLKESVNDMAFINKIFAEVEAQGVTVVVGAANDSLPADFSSLAQSPYSLAVGAVRYTDQWELKPASFSNFGYMVRVSAPGYDIYSGDAYPDGKSYILLPGTSMASPHVAGLAALIVAAYPDLTPSEIRKAIIGSAYRETRAGSPRPWYLEDREVNQEMDAWSRALLLLMGKDGSKLLDSQTHFFLMALIPPEHNRIWDGPHVALTGEQNRAGDRAIGGFIDARAALENAGNRTFEKQFALFNNADIAKMENINSKQLYQVHNIVRFAGRYAASKEIGGPFELRLKEPFKRLDVVRDRDPGGNYSEYFEYVKGNTYRHVCSFNGENYQQGQVVLSRHEFKLTIKNIRMNQEVSYPFFNKKTAQAATVPEHFATIAGGTEPNALGRVYIEYLSPQEKTEQREFWVYPPGVLPLLENIVFQGQTGETAELMTGPYDIKVLAHPTIWIRGVRIEKDTETKLKVGGYGKIIINTSNSLGEPRHAYFFMYDVQDKEKNISTEKTDKLTDVVAGTYYIHVDLDPDITYDNVDVTRGQTTKINIPQSGRILVQGLNPVGEPAHIYVRVYKPEDTKHNFAWTYTNKPMEIPAGTYDLKVVLKPYLWFRGVEVRSGEATELNLPLWGRLVVTGKTKEKVRVYEHGKKEDSVALFYTDSSIDLSPGLYDLLFWRDTKQWVDGVKLTPGETTQVNAPR